MVASRWWGGVLATELPVETFFREFQYRNAQISPDGSRIALLAPIKHRVGLSVIDLEKNEAHWVFADRQADVHWFRWATTNRLIVRLGLDGYTSPGLLAVNRDGTKPVTLVRMGDSSTRFLCLLPESPGEILVSSWARANPNLSDNLLLFPHVERMNIYSGGSVREVTNPGKVIEWITDTHGVVRIGVTLDGPKYQILHRSGKDAPWVQLEEYEYTGKGFWPQGFEADNRTLLGTWAGDGDTEAVYGYDVETRKMKGLAFRHAQADVEKLIFSERKHSLAGVRYQTERPEVYWFDRDFRSLQASVDQVLTNTLNVLVSWTRDESKAIVLASNDRDPGTFYLVDARSAKLRRLFPVAEWLDPEQMSEMKPIEFTARDGLKIHGYLTVPKGRPGTHLPMVVNPHGGPRARDEWGFDPEVQFLANRGYAVLRVNFRGSTGYGQAFLKAGYKQWGLKQQDDITDGVRWAIAEGIADPKRIAIYGASYGGFAALCGLEQSPELYRCGISYAGVTDILRTVKRDIPMLQVTKADIAASVGDPKKDKELLKEVSPMNHVEDIQAPVLLAYGRLDPKVPIATATDLARRLKKRGKLYDFIIKDEEEHGFHRESNRIEFWQKVDEFLRANLKPPGGHS